MGAPGRWVSPPPWPKRVAGGGADCGAHDGHRLGPAVLSPWLGGDKRGRERSAELIAALLGVPPAPLRDPKYHSTKMRYLV
jgi:hypothetical protein